MNAVSCRMRFLVKRWQRAAGGSVASQIINRNGLAQITGDSLKTCLLIVLLLMCLLKPWYILFFRIVWWIESIRDETISISQNFPLSFFFLNITSWTLHYGIIVSWDFDTVTSLESRNGNLLWRYKVFTVACDQFSVSLMNRSISLLC